METGKVRAVYSSFNVVFRYTRITTDRESGHLTRSKCQLAKLNMNVLKKNAEN